MDATDIDTTRGRGAGQVSIPLSVAIVDAVTAHAHVSEENLEPLYKFVDPDALDALFAPRSAGTERPTGAVRFRYNDYWVTVTADREIAVEPIETTSP